jgi:hypothetical protein
MPGDPKDCRQHALNCAKFAERATTPEQRDYFVNLSQKWIELAVELESAQALIDALNAMPGRVDGPDTEGHAPVVDD